MKFSKRILFAVLFVGAVMFACSPETVNPKLDNSNSLPDLAASSEAHPAIDPICGTPFTLPLVSENGTRNVDYCGFVPCGPNEPEWGSVDVIFSEEKMYLNYFLPFGWFIKKSSYNLTGNGLSFSGNGIPSKVGNDWVQKDINPVITIYQEFIELNNFPNCFDAALNIEVVKLDFFSGEDPLSTTQLWVFNDDFNVSNSPQASTSPFLNPICRQFCAPPCTGLLVMDEDAVDAGNNPRLVKAAKRNGSDADFLTNDDLATENGNPWFRWNQLFPGDTIRLKTGQAGDEGVFTLPANPMIEGVTPAPWDSEQFAAGTVSQDDLDKITGVNPLNNSELNALVGQSFIAVVYDSDISMNYDSPPLGTNASLKGARLGRFAFTVIDTKSGGSGKYRDLVVVVNPVPAQYSICNP